jgi:hypothetical protein
LIKFYLLLFILNDVVLLFGRAALMIAIDAIDRSAGARLEGDPGVLSAFTAFDGEELSGSGRRKGRRSFLNRFLWSFGGAGNPAGGTALGRMVMALGLEGRLFFHSENIGGFTIEAD